MLIDVVFMLSLMLELRYQSLLQTENLMECTFTYSNSLQLARYFLNNLLPNFLLTVSYQLFVSEKSQTLVVEGERYGLPGSNGNPQFYFITSIKAKVTDQFSYAQSIITDI